MALKIFDGKIIRGYFLNLKSKLLKEIISRNTAISLILERMKIQILGILIIL